MTQITFHAEGIPAPKGSKVRTRYGMRESSKRVKPWEQVVTAAAIVAGDEAGLFEALTPPYRVEMWFYIAKPRTSRATHPVAPAIGDLDKCVRSTADAIVNAGLIEDDRHITQLYAEKTWAINETPGVIVRVTEIGETP